MTPKPWWESKTLWINALTLLVMVLGTVAQWPEFSAYAPQIAGAVAKDAAQNMLGHRGLGRVGAARGRNPGRPSRSAGQGPAAAVLANRGTIPMMAPQARPRATRSPTEAE